MIDSGAKVIGERGRMYIRSLEEGIKVGFVKGRGERKKQYCRGVSEVNMQGGEQSSAAAREEICTGLAGTWYGE